jgi:hypothetical protein
VTVRVEAVVVANVEVPTTFNVPCAVTDEVEVISPPVSVPTVAFVVEEFVTLRLRIVARLEKKVSMKPLVLVLSEVTNFVELRFVEKRLLDVALVMTEDDAKIFCAKRLRNRLNAVPIL